MKVFPNNISNNFTYNLSNNLLTAKIDFDYIDKNDGAIIQISHTGESSEDIELKGKIMGAGKPFLKLDVFHDTFIKDADRLSFGLFNSTLDKISAKNRRKIIIIAFLTASGLYFVLSLISLIIYKTLPVSAFLFATSIFAFFKSMKYIENIIPKSLENFYEELN